MQLRLFTLPENERFLVLGVILVVFLIVRVTQFYFAQKGTRTHLLPGTHRDYGFYGGAICPKCHRPISLSLVSIKLGFGSKIARCEHCGKWSIVRRASPAELRAAEDAELADAQQGQVQVVKSESEKLQTMVDESRYTDKL